MKVLILAAGYGTRLYSIIKDTPKPLIQIAGRPLIHYVLDKIKNFQGLNEVIVVTNQKFEQHFKDWAAVQKYRFLIRIVNDGSTSPENRLGSVGDIDFVINGQNIAEDLLVIGGDNLFDYSLDDYIAFAQKHAPHITIGLYDIKSITEASKFGVVALDKEERIVSFEEKPKEPKSSLIAMCCYYFPKATLPCVREYIAKIKNTDKAGDYIKWLAQEKCVYGFQFQGKWYDIGSVESYEEAQKKFLK